MTIENKAILVNGGKRSASEIEELLNNTGDLVEETTLIVEDVVKGLEPQFRGKRIQPVIIVFEKEKPEPLYSFVVPLPVPLKVSIS